MSSCWLTHELLNLLSRKVLCMKHWWLIFSWSTSSS